MNHAPLVLLLATAVFPAAVRAQVLAEPVLDGLVLRGEAPYPGAVIVLHRVSPALSGEVDSVSAAPDGRFRLELPSVPAAAARNEVYFASVRHHGVLYFGELLGEAFQLDSLYRIQVHDTASAPPGGLDLPVEVRNLVLEAGSDGSWQVTDLIQVHNDADRTWVSREEEPIWSYPLPPGASDFILGQGDLPEDGVTFSGGAFHVSAPIPPGERLYIVRYTMPGPVAVVPLPGVTEEVQLLVREPAPRLAVSGLAAEPSVELEPGSTYRVFSGGDLFETEARLTLDTGRLEVPMAWIAVLLALLLAGVGIWTVGRRDGAGGGVVPAPAGDAGREPLSRGEILATIARLDESFEAGDGSGREEYEARRRALKERLSASRDERPGARG